MEVVKTTGTEETLNYTTVISTLKNDFEIPLSVRAEKEAHIFLCDGAFPPRSNCYWFMLQIYGVPYRVRNFVVINKTSSSVALQWHKSTKIYGKLKHHILEYQLLSNVACNFSTNFSSKSLEVNGTFATVKNLLPYSLYSFSVSTVNTKITGRPQILEVATLPANSIHNDEIPEIIAIEPSVVPNEATIKLSRVNCTKIRGPLLVKITPSCFNKWGKRHKAKTYQLPKTELLLNELTPFSDYRLKMKFCRNETNCDNVVESHTFKTAPGVPHAVKDLLVYSKNESTIYLRWKPPYPPTGILDYFYNVRYGVFGGKPSEPPYDLKIVWTEENDLKLQWKHPNQSNGEIQYFKIEAIPPYYARELKIEKQLPITAYNLTYHYKIETQDLLPSTRYRINVAAFNGYFGKPVTVMDTSPPDIPSINGDLHTESSNHSITVEIQTKSGQDYDTYYGLILLISDEHVNVKSYPGLENFDLKNFRIVSKCKLINFDHVYRFIIGDNSQQKHCDGKMENPPLSGGTSYNVTVILTNTFQNKIRYNLYSRICNTTGDTMKKEDKMTEIITNYVDGYNQQLLYKERLTFFFVMVIILLGQIATGLCYKRLVVKEVQYENVPKETYPDLTSFIPKIAVHH
ncbi:fn3 domain containing protein [Asbolus verrucosus]|uniref:Fn3 domain containing protein n=1 Tax=Asbolus verrucosus TaxID=1661398 RepID=A0A482W2H8_ASBVE|nr:fn3 domain containing protein [Asbolus verrucosus]